MFNAKYYLTFGIVLLAPLYSTMLAITFLLGIDFFTGIWAAKRKGEKITSHKMGDTVNKIVLYNVLIITAHIVETYLIHELPFVRLAVGLMTMREMYSFMENVQKATGLNILDYFKKIVSKKEEVKDIFDIGPNIGSEGGRKKKSEK